MFEDIIVNEVRSVREKIAEEYDYDIQRLGLMAKQLQQEHKKQGWKIVTKETINSKLTANC